MSDLKVKKSSASLSTTWKVERSHVGAYSGGKVHRFEDMQHFACQFDDTVKVLHIESGQVVYNIKEFDSSIEAETLVCFAVHPNGNEIVTASKNGLLRHWNLAEKRLVRVWKSAHTSPVLSMAYDTTGTLVATGGSDKTVQVWDVEKGYATHMFRGHAGIVHEVNFHPDPRHLLLFSFSDDCTIRVWDLNRHKCAATITDHLSPATSIIFSPDGQTFVTGGRDGVLLFFSLNGFSLLKTLPVYEILEGMCMLPGHTLDVLEEQLGQTQRPLEKSFCFATAGRKGSVRMWRCGLEKAATNGSHQKKKKTNKKRQQSTPEASKLVCELLLQEHVGQSDSSESAATETTHLSTAALMRLRQQKEDEDARAPPKKRGKKNRKKARGSLDDAGHGTAEKEGYSHVFLLEPFTLVVVSHDHNFHFMDSRSSTLKRIRQVMGFNDEILDVKFIPDANTKSPSASARQRIAMATNSEHVRIVDLGTFDTTILTGHSAMVLALAVSPQGALLATTSQDATCRIWSLERGRPFCVGICRGHTAAVGAVSFPNREATALRPTGPAFVATASADMSVKLWDLRPVLQYLLKRAKSCASRGTSSDSDDDDEFPEPIELNVLCTVAAHKKDINTVTLAPNDQMLASASQDKRVALWRVNMRSGDDIVLEEVARLQGHRRGVWCARFSPVDRVIATGSADRTVKVWSVTTFECLQTLEGHSASVLNLRFLRGGVQVLSAGADGLLKLWTLRSNECVNTFDAHDDKIWALEALPDGPKTGADGDGAEEADAAIVPRIITGASDSALKIWYDATAEVEDEAIGQREEFVLREQEMLNAYRSGKYARAMTIALEIDQPLRLRGLLEKLVEENSLDKHVGAVVFTPQTLTRFLLYIRDWNTNARFCEVAQQSLSFVLKTFSFAQLRRAVKEAGKSAQTKGNAGSSEEGVTSVHEIVAGLVAYSERHLKRSARVYQSSFVVEYTLKSMQKLLPQQELIAETQTAASDSTSVADQLDNETTVAAAGDSDDSSSSSSSSDDDDDDDNKVPKTVVDTKEALDAGPVAPPTTGNATTSDASTTAKGGRRRRRRRSKKA